MGEGSVSFLNIIIRFSYLAGAEDVVVRKQPVGISSPFTMWVLEN